MSEYTVQASTFYLQKNFPQQSELRLRDAWQIAAGEKIIAALWTGAFSRKGFVITDKILRWKLPQAGSIGKFSVKNDVSEVAPKVIVKNAEGEDTTFNLFKLTPEQAKDFGGLLLAIFKSHEIPADLLHLAPLKSCL